MSRFALYWDESDEHDDSYEKLRRALYASKEEAINQGMHDTLCLRCRVLENGRTTLKSTGVEPLGDGKEKCRDCGGSKVNPSRRIVAVEELDDDEVKKFHVESKGVAGPTFNRGKVVWEPDKKQVK